MGVRAVELPAGALLERYRVDPLPGCEPAYVDSYAVSVAGDRSLQEFVSAFYTTPLFRMERLILSGLFSLPSTDADARAV
ncbi:MAG: hypothetical protein QNJ00_11885, partial [Woeseiaceae bacterium]|nr:hypothetical protein [Woeseiaceae bacterium]